MRDIETEFFGGEVQLPGLNVGCGSKRLSGWVNADLYGDPDVRFDMVKEWPFENSKFQSVYASHVLEHFRDDDLFHVMYEIGRVLRPGGHLLGVTPYGLTTLQLCDPWHKQAWSEHTPPQFDSRRFQDMHEGRALWPWTTVRVSYVFNEKWSGMNDVDLRTAMWHYVNVASELFFVMRKEPM